MPNVCSPIAAPTTTNASSAPAPDPVEATQERYHSIYEDAFLYIMSHLPFQFGPDTTATDLRVHLDVLDIPKKEQQKALSKRLNEVLDSPSFELAHLCKRIDLAELKNVLETLRLEFLPKRSLFSRLKKASTKATLKAENRILLEKAIEKVEASKLQQVASSQELRAALKRYPMDTADISKLILRGGRITDRHAEFRDVVTREVAMGSPAMLALLARAGLDFNTADSKGERPLQEAKRRDDVAITEAVLRAGANPHAKSN